MQRTTTLLQMLQASQSHDSIVADRALQLLPGDETYVLTILDEERVRAACGTPNLLEQITERDAYHHPLSRQFFASLLGFDPPPGLRALRTQGRSMIPGIAEDQWIVFLPSAPGDPVASGHRYVFQIEEEDTGDWSLALKRLQPFTGGGLRVISDNLAAGIVDEVLVPAKSTKGVDRRGWLEHRETGARRPAAPGRPRALAPRRRRQPRKPHPQPHD